MTASSFRPITGKRHCFLATFTVIVLLTTFQARSTEPPPGVVAGSVLPHPSIHQRELEAHDRLAPPPQPSYPLQYIVKPSTGGTLDQKTTLTKDIYGFLPYWEASDISHIRWDLLSYVAYFSLEMNADGSIADYHNWPSGTYVQALLSTAHANGTRVTVAATLFSSSSIGTLLGNATYRQNAINNLVAQVQAGGADGVNIDFEGVPSDQKANLVTFMSDLTTAVHSAVPGSHVSLCTPAVDWSGAFDYDQLALACDGMFIMAYDYYYSGSSTAGPCAPLDSSSTWGTYSVTWTVNDYLTWGGSENSGQFILGVPYYGYEWPTTSTSVPSSTTGSGTAKIYNTASANASTYGRNWNDDSQTPYYVYDSSGAHQGWYDDAQSLGLKWDLVNDNDFGGTGMWALNYDTNDSTLWDELELKFTKPTGDLAGIKIGIDPGHGGDDSGAIGPTGLTEKEVNLATSLMMRDALEARGASVYMTRTDDSTVSLSARTDYVNSIPVDRFESCHYNSSGTASANYTGVHVYADSGGNCVASANSKDMAKKTALRLDAALNIGVVSSNCDNIYGVHGDDFYVLHHTSMPAMLTEASFISNPTEEGLLYTDARRCTIAGAIVNGIEDHYGVPASDPPCAGPQPGTCANPYLIDSFPYSDSNTTTGKSASLDGYSCPPSSGSEAGPEVVYSVRINQPGSLTATISNGTGVDIDVHLLSSCDPSACLARDDTSITVSLQPGTYTLVCDTWTSSSGTQYPGPYTLNVSFTPSPEDVTSPAAVQNLVWNDGLTRWEWNAVTLDRLGGTESGVTYQIWTAAEPNGPWTLVQSGLSNTYYQDTSSPVADACTFYQIRAVDGAGNRDNPDLDAIVDNPDASFSGSWSTGTSAAGHWGDDYRFVDTGGTGTNTATWSFSPDEQGYYDIFVYYPSGSNRSTEAGFTVESAGGSDLVTINQQVNGGTWVKLGSWWLEPYETYSVVLDDAEPSGFVVIADAVRWTKAP